MNIAPLRLPERATETGGALISQTNGSPPLECTRIVSIGLQFGWLLILSLAVACVAWTVTHEEVFREPRDYCQRQSKHATNIPRRKFFYLFTCEYCFSHYVAALFLAITRFKLLYPGWRGYVIALFALGWVAKPVHERLQPPASRHQT